MVSERDAQGGTAILLLLEERKTPSPALLCRKNTPKYLLLSFVRISSWPRVSSRPSGWPSRSHRTFAPSFPPAEITAREREELQFVLGLPEKEAQ